MPFSYILANLLAETPNAIAVMFMDDAGETVELATSEYTPFDVQVVGAYLGIHVRQTQAGLEGANLGEPRTLHIQHENVHLHLQTLPDGYFLALLQKAPAVVGAARQGLRRAAKQLTRELFPE